MAEILYRKESNIPLVGKHIEITTEQITYNSLLKDITIDVDDILGWKTKGNTVSFMLGSEDTPVRLKLNQNAQRILEDLN